MTCRSYQTRKLRTDGYIHYRLSHIALDQTVRREETHTAMPNERLDMFQSDRVVDFHYACIARC